MSAFLAPWLVAFIAFPRHRKAMIWASLFTMPFGLTEPLFVPERDLWELVQRHLRNTQMQELYGGFVYIFSVEVL